MIQTLIAKRTALELSFALVGRLLAQRGLPRKPLRRTHQKDRFRVAQWLKREYPRIRVVAKREKSVIYLEDESGVFPNFHYGSGCVLIEALRCKLHPYFPPLYSPELNPGKPVWSNVQNNAVARSGHDGSDLHRTVAGRNSFLHKHSDRVRRFLLASDTRCTA